jgi:multidrug resistance efflux pump
MACSISKTPEKSKSMTVFRSDRHEDVAAMVVTGLLVVVILSYMAFFTGPISFNAPSDGKIIGIAVSVNAPVKKGDVLLTMEVKEKKVANGKLEEKVVEKAIKSKMDGTVIKLAAAAGASVNKDKDLLMVLKPNRGSLP